eukprot:9493871-Pyramimonas_sp.AAC.2
MLILAPLDWLRAVHPTVGLTAVVDDIIAKRTGSLVRTVREVGDAVFRLKTLLGEADLQVATKKSRKLANHPEARAAVAQRLRGPLGAIDVEQERNLGVDFSGDKRIGRAVRGQRLQAAQQ